MPKDKSVNHKSSSNRTRASPYDRSMKVSDGNDSTKSWEEVRCPICIEHPHNAVELQCSSRDKGCRPFMCDTSYRHSNCFDLFCKSSWSSEERLVCPLCRGTIIGANVKHEARKFMNSKTRSCSLETCDFSGNYAELKEHARLEHPTHRPSVACPTRESNWVALEQERDLQDTFAHQFADYYPSFDGVSSPDFSNDYPNTDDTSDLRSILGSLYSSDDSISWSGDSSSDFSTYMSTPLDFEHDDDDLVWEELFSYVYEQALEVPVDFIRGENSLISRSGNHRESASSGLRSSATYSARRESGSRTSPRLRLRETRNSANINLSARSGNNRENIPASPISRWSSARWENDEPNRVTRMRSDDLRWSDVRNSANMNSSTGSRNYRENIPARSRSRWSSDRIESDEPNRVTRMRSDDLRWNDVRNSANMNSSTGSRNYRENIPASSRSRWSSDRIESDEPNRVTRMRSDDLRWNDVRNSANMNSSTGSRNYRANIPASSRSRWSSDRIESDEPNRVTRMRSDDLRWSDIRNSANMNSSTRSRNYRENIPASPRSRWSSDRGENDEPNQATRLTSDDLRSSDTRNSANINSSTRSRNYRENIPASSRSRGSSDRRENDEPNLVTRLRADELRLRDTSNIDNIISSTRSRNYRENIPASSRSRGSSDRWENDEPNRVTRLRSAVRRRPASRDLTDEL